MPTASATHYHWGIILGTPDPVVNFIPAAPVIASTVAAGSLVATVYVTMYGGKSFTGTLSFGPPFFDDGGLYQISGSAPGPFTVIVGPNGVGAEGGNTDRINVVATQ